MNVSPVEPVRTVGAAPREQATTLIELIIAMGVFVLCVGAALVYAQIFVLRQNELVISKLGASDQSRRGYDLMARDIRSAKSWQIGDMASGTFVPTPLGSNQQGTAVQVFLSVSSPTNIIYYFDTNNYRLMRLHTGDANSTVVAQYLTNSMSFREEDYQGKVQTDRQHKAVISTMLQFFQYQYPITPVGSNCYYDYYKIQFKLTPHVPDGP